MVKETTPLVLSRPLKLCNFVDWKNLKLVYKRYASLYFLCGVDSSDNELLVLEIIHHFVECLDSYFGNVCELDLIFNFHKAYYILDELLIAGRQSGEAAVAVSGCTQWSNPSCTAHGSYTPASSTPATC